MIFNYPKSQEDRRHGPARYASYKQYRPWLRDEFDFRCVYCLKRETWGQITSEFEIDHFEPQSLNAQLRLDYLNLVYACRRCNAVKKDQTVADPFQLLRFHLLTVQLDGSLITDDRDTQRLISQLDLNSPNLKSWRVMWMRIVALAKERHKDLYLQIVGFPKNLPNLWKLKPPLNTKEGGLNRS